MRPLIYVFLFAITAFSQIPAIEPGVSEELAKWRATQYSNISYKLNLTLEKMSPVLRGSIEIHVTQAAYACAEPNCPPMEIILDWRKIKGAENSSRLSNVSLNGRRAESITQYESVANGGSEDGLPPDEWMIQKEDDNAVHYEWRYEHLIFRDGVRMGENVIKLDFTSPILTSGSGITRYIDKEDGAEYIYSLFVPSDASTAFPVFDQPDLKARFSLEVDLWSGLDWQVISNSHIAHTSSFRTKATPENKNTSLVMDRKTFAETKPISTYVFAFATGPFQKFDDTGDTGGNASVNERARSTEVARGTRVNAKSADTGSEGTLVDTRVSARSVFVRKSQAVKFKPHAAEVFRLQREAVKYLETYFDYKFPWPKYNLVLIPEFPFGGMEHAGATFIREDRVIFPAEPTANDYITRANVIFHEAAHQWFGDCVTMRWFDDLWLKEGFAEFMAYKTLEHVMPEYNAWKVFYERNKQAAYATDSTKGTTAIYQPIKNLSEAKSAYGNIVYRKAPSFFRQAEHYLGDGLKLDKDANGFYTVQQFPFRDAVRAFLKNHEFGNANWNDLVKELENAGWRQKTYANVDLAHHEPEARRKIRDWANGWIKNRGLPIVQASFVEQGKWPPFDQGTTRKFRATQKNALSEKPLWTQTFDICYAGEGQHDTLSVEITDKQPEASWTTTAAAREGMAEPFPENWIPKLVMPNCHDYGYGIFLLDGKSRDYVLKNIQNEKDPFLRSMMWGALWDSVREAELDPREHVELVIKVLSPDVLSPGFSRPIAKKRPPKGGTQNMETDETTIQSLLGRVSTALNYYIPAPSNALTNVRASATLNLRSRFEDMLLDRLQNASTAGQRITYFRAFVNNASTTRSRSALKQMLAQSSVAGAGKRPSDAMGAGSPHSDTLRTKDRFDIVTRLAVLDDPDAPRLLAGLEKTETSDDAKRYAYAAHAAFGTAENKAKFFNDFLSNKDISESWIESAIIPFNSIRHADLTQQYLSRALAELPNLKRTRKIFFVGNWLSAFIGGQRDEKALAIINKFLADNPNLDNDLRLKILENSDLIERSIKIGATWQKPER
jgi:aminopeptidase N